MRCKLFWVVVWTCFVDRWNVYLQAAKKISQAHQWQACFVFCGQVVRLHLRLAEKCKKFLYDRRVHLLNRSRTVKIGKENINYICNTTVGLFMAQRGVRGSLKMHGRSRSGKTSNRSSRDRNSGNKSSWQWLRLEWCFDRINEMCKRGSFLKI